MDQSLAPFALFSGKFVWTNGAEGSSKVSPTLVTGIGPWMALPSLRLHTGAPASQGFSNSENGAKRAFGAWYQVRLFYRGSEKPLPPGHSWVALVYGEGLHPWCTSTSCDNLTVTSHGSSPRPFAPSGGNRVRSLLVGRGEGAPSAKRYWFAKPRSQLHGRHVWDGGRAR